MRPLLCFATCLALLAGMDRPAPAAPPGKRAAAGGRQGRVQSGSRSRSRAVWRRSRSAPRSSPAPEPDRSPSEPTQPHHPHHGGHGGAGRFPSGAVGYTYGPYSYYLQPPLYRYGPYVPGYGGIPPGYRSFGYGGGFAPPVRGGVSPGRGFFPDNEAIREARREGEKHWQGPLDLDAGADPDLPPLTVPSTRQERIRSIRAQARGDYWFGKQEYPKALERYRRAVDEAPDRAEARFRLGFALTAVGSYREAVAQFRKGLRLEPSWPVTGESLTAVFGEEQRLAKSSIMHQVTRWVRDDIRDPDRLFLLGVLLHFDGREDDAQTVFQTAQRLSGGGDHLRAFLNPVPPERDREAGAIEAPDRGEDGLPEPPPPEQSPGIRIFPPAGPGASE